jgi:hypothetical protein
MPADLTADDRAALESVVSQLEAAWNAMDGPAFAAPFASGADFVTIRGKHEPVHHRRNPAAAPGGGTGARALSAGCPSRPLAGKHRARFSLVLTKEAGRWEIAALHNTLEAVQGPPR